MPTIALYGTIRRRARSVVLCGLALLVAASIGVLYLAEPAHAAAFTVNTKADRADQRPGDGSCSTGIIVEFEDGGLLPECTLRAAIEEANANGNAPTVDRIRFGIQTTGIATISPTRALPTIVEPLLINGYSQPGASVNTATTGTNAVLKVVLDGSKAGSTPQKPVDGLVLAAPDSTVRGLVINNGFRSGVLIDRETPIGAGRTVAGCFLGTDVSGMARSATANGGGVIVDDGRGNVIGGDTLAARNIISGSNSDGIFVSAPARGNRIQGNLIGTKADGTSPLGNFKGVYVIGGTNNTIGGSGAARNTIASNRDHGIQVQESSAPNLGLRNRILFNSIYGNAGLGINLAADGGVTANDGDNPATPEIDPDSDTGANRLQNYPVIGSANVFLDGTTDIAGRLTSTPRTDFTIQFFSSPAAEVDRSGFGEGKTFIGEIRVTTNRNGNRPFTYTSPRFAAPNGSYVTATATNTSTGDTSEFSRASVVERPVAEQ